MDMTMIMGGYDMPSFKLYGVQVKDPPEGDFEMTIKAKITRQDTPVHGEPCVEITVLDIVDSDGVKIEETEDESKSEDVGDSLEGAMEAAASKKKMDMGDMGDGEDY